MIHLRPAAFTSRNRPSRKITPRSYSWSTRTPTKNSTARIASAPSRPVDMSPPRAPGALGCARRAPYAQLQPLDRGHLDASAPRNGFDRGRVPVLAADEYLARRIEVRHHLAHGSDQLVHAAGLAQHQPA